MSVISLEFRAVSRKNYDALLRYLYRITKWVSDPVGFFARIHDTVIIPRKGKTIDFGERDI